MRATNALKILAVVCIAYSVTGCNGKGSKSWFRDRSEDYVNAQCCPAIQVPAGLHPEAFSEEYEIPGQ